MPPVCDESTGTAAPAPRRYAIASLLLLLVLAGGLVTYKASGALETFGRAAATGALPMPGQTGVEAIFGMERGVVARSAGYLQVIWPALLFGVLISGAVRTFVPPDRLLRAVARPARAHIAAGLAGAPLMLCSCCVAPIFSAAYERSARLGPALALMLAAPALNPAAIALTFLLFAPQVAWMRLLLGLTAVFAASALMARFLQPSIRTLGDPASQPAPRAAFSDFLRSSLHVGTRTVPIILLGVAVAMAIVEVVPIPSASSPTARIGAIALTALIVLPVALPTFFEIPLAATLLSAGAPAGAAVAILFAGPAINLPSLFTIARSASWKVAAAVGVMVWLLAVLGGVLMVGS